MASLRQIRRRMKSIDNIHEITKAMEMIAAFRFKRAFNRFAQSKVYLNEMEKFVGNLSGSAKDLKHPLFEKRKMAHKTLVVVSADKGLCGAYNVNLIKNANAWLKENAGVATAVVPVGKIASENFRKRQMTIKNSYPEKAMVDAAFAKKITLDLKNLFLSGKTDSVEILVTSFRAGGMGLIKRVPFLSMSYLLENLKESSAGSEYITEPGFDGVFLSLVERFLEAKIYILLLESLVSEFNARMVAMKQATDNAEDVLDKLKLLRNKTRQASITRELSEIVSGASILV